jgi:hypothetical protein
MAAETLPSEERPLTTTGHISPVVGGQKHANEIGTRNQSELRSRLEIAVLCPWRSGRVIATGPVQTLYPCLESQPDGTVTDSAIASQIGVCRPLELLNANPLFLRLFTTLTNAKVHHQSAQQLNVQRTHRHEKWSRGKKVLRLDREAIPGAGIPHLRRGHLSGHLHPPVPKRAHETVIEIESHLPTGYRRCDGGVAQYTHLQRTNSPTPPYVATMRLPQLRAALRHANLDALKATRRSPAPPTAPYPKDREALETRYRNGYRNYIAVYYKMSEERAKIQDALDDLGREGSVCSDRDVEMMDEEGLRELAGQYEAWTRELEGIRNAYSAEAERMDIETS